MPASIQLALNISAQSSAKQSPMIMFGNQAQVGTINIYHGCNENHREGQTESKQQRH